MIHMIVLAIAAAGLLALPVAAADVRLEAEQTMAAVRQKLDDRTHALTADEARGNVRDAEISLKRAENRQQSGNSRGALKHAKKAQQQLTAAEEVQK